MSYQIDEGNFNYTLDFVDIAGSFNGWGSPVTQLSDEDGDSVYTVTISGFSIGQEIAFKFRINGEWNGKEEFPGGGPNRTYAVKSDSNLVSVWYNNEQPAIGPAVASYTLSSNSIAENRVVYFKSNSAGKVTNLEWIFEGGNPSTSISEIPAIRYENQGTFDVTLIAFNGEQSDTLFTEDAITVNPKIDIELGATRWWNEAVFYEIFVRSFYDSDGDGIGDFRGIIEKLDYLNDGNPDTDTDLGITGIWLMPIHDSPSYHGYDVIDYRSIHPDYGTMQDFKDFLAAAHERGIKVIIDYVMNHTSTQHPWFQKSAANDPFYRDFYRWSVTKPTYSGPWGQNVWHNRNGSNYYGLFWGGMPDLNYENPAVKDSMFAISDFWINDIGVDGFRQDAVLYIYEDGEILKNTDETLQFWQDFSNHVRASNPEAFNVGEAWEPTDIVLKYISNDRLDYAFEFDLAGSILNSVRNGNASSVANQMQKVYDNYPFLQYGTFLTNHDQNRVMNELGESIEDAKLAASLYLTLPGIPYIYYGEEVGMLGAKPDENIRLPMQWSSVANAGFSSTSPWRAPNANFASFNVEDQLNDENSLLNHYKKLIHFRNDSEVLKTGLYEAGISERDDIFAFVRYSNDSSENNPVLVVINLGDEEISNPTFGFSNEPFNGSNAFVLEDDNSATNVDFINSSLILNDFVFEPKSTRIFSVIGGTINSNENSTELPKKIQLEQNYPNPFNPSTQISFYLPTPTDVKLSVFDVTGRLVGSILNERRNSGNHTVSFDASHLSSGLYFYSIETVSTKLVKKMLLVK